VIVDREIGRLNRTDPAKAGPTLIAVAAIHGNEQAGIHAARRVLARLSKEDVTIEGELVFLAGNVGAIAENRRYRVRDLNRVWVDANIATIEAKESGTETRGSLDPEEHEVLDLLAGIRGAIARATGPVYLVDLHTTSASGVPFALFGDTPGQRLFAGAFPLPVIMGLEEQLQGVLSSYWTKHGCTTLAVEGGQHDEPGTIDNLEAVLLVAAEAAGVIAPGSVADVASARGLLEARRADLPRVMEVISRHAITPEDSFKMEPGFRNLDYARAAQLLARDRTGEIRAASDGLVILPLYQGQGEDGFFWGRVVDVEQLRAK
jgi:predicted deacylase